MGLWDWLWDTLSGRSAPRGTSPSRILYSKSSDSTAVSVLEPPDNATTEPVAAVEDDSVPAWWNPEGVTQIDPITPERPRMMADVRALEERLISYFDGHDLTLPSLPRVAEKVLKHLRSSKSNMAEIAHDLSEDPVSTAAVLRAANSPLYRGVDKINTLQLAVPRLGACALKVLMMHQSLRSAVFQQKGKPDQLSQSVWRGSLASAAVMRELAGLLHIEPEEAFLTGLMRDIGNVIVLRLMREQEQLTNSAIETETFHYLCHETHQEFGELIADAWKMPVNLKSLIANHHAFPLDDDPLRRERLMLILTDMICQMLGYMPEAQYDLMRAQAVHDLGLADNAAFEVLLARLPNRIEETALEFK
ncbi:MAG: HDOD domain-containing protein [Planctomycetes bacterium]|nr:HDOD domain-containing protein [Planctomycetota bacterium]MBI3834593.1 HDOD domain-containing protein [Planctomycetota bacterium]